MQRAIRFSIFLRTEVYFSSRAYSWQHFFLLVVQSVGCSRFI